MTVDTFSDPRRRIDKVDALTESCDLGCHGDVTVSGQAPGHAASITWADPAKLEAIHEAPWGHAPGAALMLAHTAVGRSLDGAPPAC